MARTKSLAVHAALLLPLSGRPGALRRRAPLGTGLASFPASGSSKP